MIQSLLDNSKIFNKPTKKGLPSYYISNEEPEDTSDKESEADSINETPIIFDHLFTPKSKDINKDLTPKESSNEKIHKNGTTETLKNSILNMNAELMALKSFVMDELYGLNKNIDRVRIEQCDQTNFMEGMKKMLEESKTKTEIIKTLSDNVNIIATSYRNISKIKKSQHTDKLDFYEKQTTNDDFRQSRKSAKNSNSENRFVAEPINVSKNLFNMLEHNESNSIHFDIDDEPITTKNLTEIQNHLKLQNVKRRPPVVVNQNPENQSVFTKKRTLPGESLYSEAVKSKPNNQNIKIFSDSIAKGIRIRQLNQFAKSGNARIHSFLGANSKHLLHYLDVNLDNKTDTAILHICVNDLLQDVSLDNFNKFMKNLEYIVQKCRSFGVKRGFFSGITYTKRIAWQILDDVHEQLVSLCKRLEIIYIDNRNIREIHLFKDGLHLLDSGKQILAKTFIFNLNIFLCQIQQPVLLTRPKTL